jgi:hypothetical protein
MWIKPRARPIGCRWRCLGNGKMRFGATMEEAYRSWAYAAGIPMKGEWA